MHTDEQARAGEIQEVGSLELATSSRASHDGHSGRRQDGGRHHQQTHPPHHGAEGDEAGINNPGFTQGPPALTTTQVVTLLRQSKVGQWEAAVGRAMPARHRENARQHRNLQDLSRAVEPTESNRI